MLTKSPDIAGSGDVGSGLPSVLLDSLLCGVLSVDAEHRQVALNPDAEHLLGAAPGSSFPFANLPRPLQSIVEEVQSAGRRIVDRRVALNLNGKELAISAAAFPVPSGGPGVGVTLVLRDLAATGRVEENLTRLNRLASLGTLSASMAHEIKNALVPIKTFVDLLLEKDGDVELAETVRREMRRVNTIVTNMLRFAAPAKPSRVPVAIHELLDHSLRMAQHRAEGKLISFQRQFEASPDVFHGDDHQLQQAVLNLLLNAVEAMGSEGTLTVATDLQGSEAAHALREGGGTPGAVLRLRITDTGTGIAPEILNSIFEPFFTTKREGTGLGLSVTRRIIEDHAGRLEVQSTPGKGTTFTVLLPMTLETTGA
ncbi:MAG: ATP-binding protein [Verrucomicrobiota bacterium]